ncbi:hypothetical protein [Salinisphaera sp. G21_0]|uniref:hypothetical protein n=1 Tax=Salinisphaera sp. G21_0 TaxID=2821094 RepID=UPI001AD9D801|nr:hypothetical protein [Salinisphaera sp. G21_0]MBO9483390.1 hypothetical protein [Salinisphaera sp. G21_0]
MCGERTSRRFGLGDELEAMASKVDLLDDKKIDFELLSALSKQGRRKSSAKGSAEDGKPSGRKPKGRTSAKTTGKKGKPTASGKKKVAGKKKSSARKSDSAKASKPTGRQPRKRKISQ